MRDPFRSVICDSLEGLYGANSVQAPEWAWSTRQKTQSGLSELGWRRNGDRLPIAATRGAVWMGNFPNQLAVSQSAD
jgi:hypothetical protein